MKRTHNLLSFILLSILGIWQPSYAQVVYTHPFTGTGTVITGGTPAATFANFNSIARSGVQLGGTVPFSGTANPANVLVEWVAGPNVVFGAGTNSGYSQTTAPLSGYSAPFSSTLSTNTGVVTWTFNMRTSVAASGYNTGSENAVVILAGTSPTVFNAGNGYAVTFNPAAPTRIQLVRYTGGLTGTVTTIISSTVALAGSTNFASVRVTYDPTSNTWSLYVRDDGAGAFVDPATGVTALGGTAVDATYTATAMSIFGFYSPHTGSSIGIIIITIIGDGKSYFDNYTVSVAGCAVAAITGPTSVCTGTTITLADATAGGAWSTASANASVGATGIVTGITAGTAAITYSVGACIVTSTVTVNQTPTAITGPTAVCTGGNITLTNASGGGTWSSGATGIATVNTSTGVVTGVSSGTAMISYILTTGCYATSIVTVTTAPTAITGNLIACQGATTALGSTPAGGVWSSTDPTVGTVSTTGVVSGLTLGTTTISYTIGSSCAASAVVSVHAFPATITGPASVCIGTTGTMVSSPTGGVWTSTNTVAAPIGGGTGIVTGANLGTATISYTLAGCSVTTGVTVLATPAPIVGPTSICIGWPTTTLTDPSTGGTWSSGDPTIGSIGATTGVVTGIAAGTTTITYALSATCNVTQMVTVLPVPAAITGVMTVCPGTTTTLNHLVGGGTWISSNANVSIGLGSGIATGVTAGTADITYTLPSGCISTAVVTVNPLPSAIGGTMTICQTATTTLINGTPGGSWSSSNTAVGTVGSSTGTVYGVSAGTTNITYTLGTGCIATAVVTVNPIPTALSGVLTVCVGATTPLGSTPGPGAWTSFDPLIASVSGLGVVSGVAAGTTTITYTVASSCYNTAVVTVNASPAAITGPAAMCLGFTTTLSDATPLGTWSSNNAAIASVAGGVVTGNLIGTTTISYTLPNTCYSTVTVTVNTLPTAISGTLTVCSGLTTALSNGVSGGTWSSSSSSTAAVDVATGVVTGGTAGTATIVYTLGTGCTSSAVVTVNALPAAITGSLTVCEGLTTALNSLTGGGTWSSSTPTAGTIGVGTGIFRGILAGTSTVTYTVATTGCLTTAVVTVNALPSAVTGTMNICATATTTLTSTPAGGIWSSGSSNATVGSLTGIVTGASAGTATIVYTLPSTCYITRAITVNALPAVITGSTGVCVGLTTALTSGPTGGTWTSSTGTVGTVDPTTGIVYGVAAGTTAITYTLPTTCRRSVTVTVQALPGNIGGTLSVCQGLTTALTNSAGGGTWASSDITIATVGTSGVVLGGNPGTTTITYTLGTGCIKTATVTVNALPGSITGPNAVCVNSTITLNCTPAGGTWGSSASIIASVSTGGVVTGMLGGTATITYTLPTTCISTMVVTVNSLPAVFGGSLTVCQGLTSALLSAPAGGTWTSSSANAPIDAVTGVVSGAIVGTANITYTLPTTCARSATVTVNPLPAAVTGLQSVCAGLTTTLNCATAGGTWTSGNNTVATITGTTGVVTGNIAGTAIMTYTLPTGCISTAVVTVNPLPAAITGTMAVCELSTTTLANSSGTGAWSSGTTAVATVDAGGVVSGIAAGTTIITFTLPTTCIATTIVTVLPLPAPIGGTLGVCEGLTTALSDGTPGGTWASSNAAVGSISSGGVVSGIVQGTTTITYKLTLTGCQRTAVVTVNPLPSAITGSSGFCNLTSTFYSSLPATGTWSTSDPSIVTIDVSTGEATGVSVGSATITHTLGTGCIATKNITIILAPFPVTGPDQVCEGATITLGNVISGGTWTSGTTAVGTVGISTGIVGGISAGTVDITYVLSNGCFSSQLVTVNQTPSAIGGSLGVCEGLTTLLSNSLAGGSWSSTDITVASIDGTTGMATGNVAGTSTISYTMPTGCYATGILTVNPLPAALTGTFDVCVGSTTTLSSPSGGGTWSSSAPGIAYADLGSGVITGMSDGTATITYTLGTGCIVTQDVTVNPVPNPITGLTTICKDDMTPLSCTTPGGIWISSDPSVASIDAMGVVTGVGSGTAIISYQLGTGCISTVLFHVNALPLPIGTSLTVCAGFATNLTNATPSGSWYSDPSASSVGTINTITGVLTGITPGTVPVTYILPTGCRISATVTVTGLPPMIAGSTQVCEQSTLPLSNAVPGGTWSSSNTARATVDASGLVTGVSAGTATITYTIGTGCFNILRVTVNPLPAAIVGPGAVCEGAQITLTDATPGGLWNSGATAVATVGITTGVVTGQYIGGVGTATISYVLSGTGCYQTKVVTVNHTPGPISGTGHICIGSLTLLTDTVAGGIWTSTVPSVATIGSLSGVVTPVSLGTTTISYTMPVTGCFAAKTVTVQPLPVVYNVIGTASYCAGGNGVHIGLDGSQIGVSYLLYHGATVTGYMTGTGFPIDFGLLTPAGTYTVLATNAISGCTQNMAGSATITITPLVAPMVTIAPTPNDSVCPGTTVTLNPMPTNGGTSPSYVWRVNGTTVSTANTYSFIPANGDVVSATITSNGNCLSTTTGVGTLTMTVLPTELPLAGINATPGDSVCQFTVTTFSANPTYGGTAPSYIWMVDGSVVGGGPSYTYTPEDNDVVTVKMISNYLCRLADTVTSGAVTMYVQDVPVPHVSIIPDPGLTVAPGIPVHFSTLVTNAGPHPKYQWKVNGHPVPGATADTFGGVFNDYDSLTCVVTSDGVCAEISTFDWLFITIKPLGVQPVSTLPTDIRLIPNPNKGLFTIKGNLASANDAEVNAEVTDMLGQVVYRARIKAVKGRIEQQVQLGSTLANGMYLLNLSTAEEHIVFHFVMEQ